MERGRNECNVYGQHIIIRNNSTGGANVVRLSVSVSPLSPILLSTIFKINQNKKNEF
jgi:hypothetical protein